EYPAQVARHGAIQMLVRDWLIVAGSPAGVGQFRLGGRFFRGPVDDHSVERDGPHNIPIASRGRDNTEPRQRDDYHCMENWIFDDNTDALTRCNIGSDHAPA